MARFLAWIKTNRQKQPITRLGDKTSPAQVGVQGWNIGINASIDVDEDGNDVVTVFLTKGSNADEKHSGQIVFCDIDGKNGKILTVEKEYRFVLLPEAKIKVDTDL